MAIQGKDYDYHYVEVSLRQHLMNIHQRLEDDVRPYVELIQKHAKNQHIGIGNFALVRMLTPIIETVAEALRLTPQEVLAKLGVKYPHLYWSIFRDVFSHSDEFEYAYVIKGGVERKVEPMIGISYPGSSGSHTVAKDTVMLTITKLFWDLADFLKNPELEFEDRRIKIKCGIEYYPDKGNQEVNRIVDEMDKLR